jgi:membrane protease YdiL (CAAX protease family)
VSSAKTTNGPVKWLADVCRKADFPGFYETAVFLAAAVLFLPWMEWVHARRGETGAGPWLLRLPQGARISSLGQPLRKNPGGPWDGCAGFMVVAGLLLSMGVALVPAGFFTMRHPDAGMAALVLHSLLRAIALAVLTEVFFRGVAMGIFLRAMRPAAALGMSAAFFALVISAMPPSGVNVADPETGGIGFELLGLLARRFADWRNILGSFAPLLALGAVLAYARWRTASLWLPVGLHTGWLFAKAMLAQLSFAAPGAAEGTIIIGRLLQQGLVPLAATLVAGVLAHYLTTAHHHEDTLRP